MRVIKVDGAAIAERAMTAQEVEKFGEALSAPAAIPTRVARAQARKALVLAGLFDSVQPAIDAIADPVQRRLVQVDWDDSITFERGNTTLLTLAAVLGLSEAQIDALFVQAAAL